MYIIVAGAGTIGAQVIKTLVDNKHDVVVIDIDREVCEAIYRDTGAMTIHGSATKINVLKKAGASKANRLLCLMRDDADNIASSLLAKSLGIKKIIARVRKPAYREAYKLSGVTTLVDMSEMLLDRIIIEVEDPIVKRIFTIGENKAGVYAVTIPEKAKVIGKSIKDIAQNSKFPDETVFTGIYTNDDEFKIPRGHNVIEAKDVVFIVAKTNFIASAVNFLTKKKKTLFGK